MDRAMPRQPSLDVPDGFYHVILRGNARRDIFVDAEDRLLWQKLICEGIELWKHRIHAYCWMTNHNHMAIQASDAPLAGFIGTLANRYAKAFNKKYGRSGHLFERRYRAIIVQDDEYLLELVRYIHQNPLRAKMISELNAYSWSSHGAYAGGPCPSFLTINTVLYLFGPSLRPARDRYLKFVGESPPQSILQDIRTGSAEDSRCLGDDDWRKRILRDRYQRDSETLDQLIERHCQQHGITESELASGSRMRDRADLRARIALEATDSKLSSVTEIAKRFGRSQPALARAINRLRRQKKS